MESNGQPAARAATLVSLVGMLGVTILGPNAYAQRGDGAAVPAAAMPGGAQPLLGRDDIPTLAQVYSLDIPPLIERPAGLEEGARVRVIDFRLDGVEERPERGLTREDIDVILTRYLAEQPLEGYTINQLQAIADDVERYYRSKGLVLARAFIPAQDVMLGEVAIQVVEGNLGTVTVQGNEIYGTQRILGPFDSLLAQAVDEADVEEALLTLQDYPGLTVFGTFREGNVLGETDLVIDVRTEDRFFVTPSVDNYGSEFTGQTRGVLQFGVNNPVGATDRLSGYVLKSSDPSNERYYGVEYSLATKNGRTRVGFGAAKNNFAVAAAQIEQSLGLDGEVEQANLYVQRIFANKRGFRADGVFDIAEKETTVTQPGTDAHDDLSTLSYTFNYFSVGRQQRGINLGYLRAIGGDNDGLSPSRQGGSGELAIGSYSVFELGYQRLQRLSNNHALLLRLDGQYSSDLLVSLEQYGLGGPANIRAYSVSEALIDSGGAATLEWIIDAPGFARRPVGNRTWGDIFQLSVFYDYAGGEVNDPLPFQAETINLRGYGIGLQFGISEKFRLRIDAATAATDAVPVNRNDPQYWASFSYTF
jgi:hemolysin activation/secretion protein